MACEGQPRGDRPAAPISVPAMDALSISCLFWHCTLDFDDTEGIKELVLPFATKSHRAKDLDLIGDEKEG